MRLGTKARRRVLILCVAVILLGGLGAGAYFYRQHQLDAGAREDLSAAHEAMDAGQYGKALTRFKGYLRRFGDDPEALRDCATAIERHSEERSRPRELRVAVGHLRRALALRPDLPGARRQLMNLYVEVGFDKEALKSADGFLRADEADRDALRARLVCLGRLQRDQEALEAGQRYLERYGNDTDAQFMVLELMSRCGSADQEIVDWAREMVAKGDGGPELRLLEAVALEQAGRREDARKLALELAEAPLPRVEHVRRLIGLLDRFGEQEAATGVMKRAVEMMPGSALTAELAVRLWERGEYEEVVGVVEKTQGRADDVELLGVGALSLARLGRTEEATANLERIRAREDDPGRAAWVALLSAYALPAKETTIRRRLDGARTAVSRDPDERVFHYVLGSAYDEAGETNLAIHEWVAALDRSATWGRLAVEAASRLATGGQPELAGRLLEEARKRWPGSGEVEFLDVVVSGAKMNQLDARGRLELVERLKALAPEYRERAAPFHVAALASLGRIEPAAGVIREILGGEPSAQLLVTLAWISDLYDLGLKESCLRRCGELHPGSIELASFRASELARENKKAEGLQLLEQASEATTLEASRWGTVVASYREAIDPAAALADWKRLGETYAADPQVQLSVLSSRSAWDDSSFVERSIERLREITGEEGLNWQMARARLLALPPDASETDLREVVRLLEDVLSVAPGLRPQRIQLASAQARLGNTKEAIENLQMAARDGPVLPEVEIQLARLMTRSGDAAGAQERLARLLGQGTVSSGDLYRSAVLLASLNEPVRALAALGRIPEDAAESGGMRGLLEVTLLARLGRRREAEERLEQCLENPSLEATLLGLMFYAKAGRTGKGDALLPRLADFDLTPEFRRTVEGAYYSTTGRPDEAARCYREAIEEKPDDPLARRNLVALLIRTGDFSGAARALADAGETLPAVSSRMDLFRFAAGEPALHGLLEQWVLDDRGTDPIVRVLEACRDLKNGELAPEEFGRRLSGLADEASGNWELQRVAAVLLSRLGLEPDALRIATRTAARFPDNAEGEALVARLLEKAGRHDAALLHARTWRRLAGDSTLEADKFTARVRLDQGDARTAVAVLSTHLGQGDGSEDPQFLLLLGRAYLAAEQPEKAEALLFPRLDESVEWRIRLADFVARYVSDESRGTSWLDRIQAKCRLDRADECFGMARAWLLGARKWDTAACRARAAGILKSLRSMDLDAQQWSWMGEIDTEMEDLAAAEASYRKSLELAPDGLVARNNLAVVLARRGEGEKAVELARGLVEEYPRMVELRDTLAFALRSAGQADEAISTLAAASELEPRNLRWKISLADYCQAAGRDDDARTYRREVREAVRSGQSIPAESVDLWKQIEARGE